MNAPTTFYDYKNQAYVIDGIIQNCGHPEEGTETIFGDFFEGCNCYGREHAGEKGCTHSEVEYFEDGNAGGFAKFRRVCKGCKNPLPVEG